MRSVRCDSCGTKALLAASKCPKCAHGFEVRDGFGELLPLSHCSACDSYYPTKAGSCRWCGTLPERAPIGPHVWKGVGVLAFVAMAWGAWMVRDDDPPADVSAARMKAMLKPDSSAASDSATNPVMLASTGNVNIDTALATPTGVVASDTMAALPDSLSSSDTTAVVPTAVDRVPDRTPTRVVDRAPSRAVAKAPARTPARVTAKPSRTLASAKASTKTTPKTVAKAPAKRPAKATAAAPRSRATSTRWVNSVARRWVTVRASASPQARIIASIGPNTRVQLGESRGGWRRIKAKGLAGWVDHRSFFATGGGARSTGRLAAR